MPALRRLLTLAVILAVTAGCSRTISVSGTQDASKLAGAAAPRTATPTPTATYNGIAAPPRAQVVEFPVLPGG